MSAVHRRTVAIKSETVRVGGGNIKTKTTITCPYCDATFVACLKRPGPSLAKAISDYDKHARKDCKSVNSL